MLISSSLCLYSSNLGTFWLKIEQFWPFEEISIFSNSGHLEWRAGLSDTILKGTHTGTIPARFGLIWFSSFRGEDLNVIFYQNMPNLHNRYISAERKITQKNVQPIKILSIFTSMAFVKDANGISFKNRLKGHINWRKVRNFIII